MILNAYGNFVNGTTAAAVAFYPNYVVLGADYGYITTVELFLSSPFQNPGFLQLTGKLSNSSFANLRDYHRRAAVEIAKKVNGDAYTVGTTVT